MRDYTPKIRKQAAGLLDTDEAVFRSVIGNPAGSLLSGLNRGRSLARATVESLTSDAPDGGLAGTIPKKNAYVTLTDRRVALLGTNKLGKPNELLASFGFDEIDAIHVEGAGFKKHNLRIDFADGTSYGYLIIQNQQPTDLAEEFARRKG